MQSAQHAGVPLAGTATLELFEQGDGVKPGIGLQQRDDLAVPVRTQWTFSGAPTALGALGGQALRLFNTPGTSLADSGFGGSGDLNRLHGPPEEKKFSSASKEQSDDVAQIGEAVTQMDQATQQNAALVKEMAAAASSLRTQASDLVNSVVAFKLPSSAMGLRATKLA